MSFGKSIIVRVLKGLFFGLLILTPLINGDFVTEYFEFPKMFFVYFVGSLIFLTYFLGLIWCGLEFKKPPLIVTLFFLIQLISTICSQFSQTAFWGYYPRLNGGLISSLTYFGLFIVAYSVFDSKIIFRFVFLSIVLTSLPISILGISQYFGLVGLPVERVYSTIGQPNWLAVYLIWAGLLLLHRFLKDAPDNLIFVWFGLFIITITCFWFTYSLSGWLALLFGVSALLYLNKSQYVFKRLLLVGLVFLLLAILSPGIIFLRIQDGLIDFLNLFTARFVVYAQSQNYQVSDPGFIRLALWEGALRMSFSSLKAFLVGFGPETFAYILPLFRTPSLNFSSEWDFILNKPHNYYLELLSESGIFSLVLHLWILSKALMKKHLWATGLLISFAISNFFGWPSVVTSLYFWFLLAGIFQYEK